MEPGKLRKRLSFQRKSTAVNSFGESTGWSEYYECWGSCTALKGQLNYSTGQFVAMSNYSLTIRYPHAVTIAVSDHIVVDGTTFEIDAVLDPEMRHRSLQLLCHVTNEVG